MELKNDPGIYAFYIPSLDSWYIGSSVNVSQRYKQHMYNSHQKILNKHKDELQFCVLTYLKVTSICEIRKEEQNYIDKFARENKKLINKSACNVNTRQIAPLSIYQYDLRGNLLNFFITKKVMEEKLKISPGRSSRILSGTISFYNDFFLIYKKDLKDLKKRLRIAKIDRMLKIKALKEKKKIKKKSR